MKLVTLALKEKGLKNSELSQALQERIASLKELTDNYNNAVDDYDEEEEKDANTEAELDKMENFIAENDADIAKLIKVAEVEGEPTPAPVAAVVTEKKKDGGLGWLILGIGMLVVTVGAVNNFKKK